MKTAFDPQVSLIPPIKGSIRKVQKGCNVTLKAKTWDSKGKAELSS
jgi:hypothetical protein